MHQQAILTALLLSTTLGSCQGSLFEQRSNLFFPSEESMVIWMTDCECDCPKTNTVHENIKRSGEASTLLLSVEQPCRDDNVELQDISVKVDDSGLLFVAANISSGDKTSISRQYQVPPTANINLITARYTEDNTLQVTIPYREKSAITLHSIDVELAKPAPTQEEDIPMERVQSDHIASRPIPPSTSDVPEPTTEKLNLAVGVASDSTTTGDTGKKSRRVNNDDDDNHKNNQDNEAPSAEQKKQASSALVEVTKTKHDADIKDDSALDVAELERRIMMLQHQIRELKEEL